MWPFRRRAPKTENEQLLEESGLAEEQEPPVADPYPGTFQPEEALGVWTGSLEPGLADVLTTVHAPGIQGAAVEFVVLPSGDLIVDEEVGDAALAPLADLVEQQLAPPYRAQGTREEGDLWAVMASAIEVAQFSFVGGDELELVMRGGALQLTVDERPVAGSVPELEDAGRAAGNEYAVHAHRLDGDLWEVRAAAL
jgi:hypothetical protein